MCNPYAYAAFQFGSAYMQYNQDKARAKQINDNTYATAKRVRNEAIYTDISLQKKKSVEYDKTAAEKFKLSLEEKKKKGFCCRYFNSQILRNCCSFRVSSITKKRLDR